MGLPPTSTKGSGDATPVTTFQINAPNIPITHAGVVATIGTIPIAGGGSGATTKAGAFDALSPMTTGGDLIYGGASGTGTRLANGSAGQYLQSAGTTNPPQWVAATATAITAAPTVQKFTTGSGTYNKNYTFVITSGSATVGATYTNNSVTFTVYATVASATQVVMSGSGAPAAAGTLTKATGTGDATLTFSLVLAPLYLKAKLVGGGGGGSGSGTAAPGTPPTAGAASTFGSSLLSAGGGGLGGFGGGGGNAGTGGTSSLGTGPLGLALTGSGGGAGSQQSLLNIDLAGGIGGSSAFGGAGPSGAGAANPGGAGAANTGGGGGGAGSPATANGTTGAGGGSGGYVDAIITSPSATYAYAVGAGGSAGNAGTAGAAGGAGGSGVVIIEEFYQ